MRVVHEAPPPTYGRCPRPSLVGQPTTVSVGLVLLSWWSRGRQPMISWHAQTLVIARDGWDHANIRLTTLGIGKRFVMTQEEKVGAAAPKPLLVSTAALETYRYLRLAMLGMVVFLASSLAIEIFFGDGTRSFGSISGYFYSPVRSAFVGSLVAVGLALIAIKGRLGWEDNMLNLAGLLAPVVAMVPTPLACPTDKDKCIPSEYVPGLENNFKALLVLGALGIAFTILNLRLDSHADTRMWWGVLVAVIIWMAQALWFWLGRDSFLVGAHYASAVPLFALLAGVAFVNARHVPHRQPPPPWLTPEAYSASYRSISYLMAGVVVIAVVLMAIERFTKVTLFASWIFLVESALLALFFAFWLLQTIENWKEPLPLPTAADTLNCVDP